MSRLRERLLQHWFGRARGGLLARVLQPLAALYGVLQAFDRRRRERRASALPQPAVPVIVVGNLVVGGAGKTPVVIALVQALQQAGWRPGIVSRGYGRRSAGLQAVDANARADAVGDEPLLIRWRTGAPVHVGRDRRAAALALLQRHPDVNVVIADDGLQHRELRREIEVVVFDERGLGNGRLLPAGPLREPPPPQPGPRMLVLYNHPVASTAWPGVVTNRQLGAAWPLAAWRAGDARRAQPLAALRGRPLLAVAGIAVPERFFSALEAAGLQIERLPLPDHFAYGTLPPWPASTREIVTTEKDAVKLAHHAADGVDAPAIWVVGLDLALPAEFTAALRARLAPGRERAAAGASPSA